MKKYLPHVRQFATYLMTGSAAVLVDIGGTWLFIHLGVHYLTASVMSGVGGFFTAFFLHKYVAFRVKGNGTRHFIKFCLLSAWNFFAQNAALVLLVERFNFDPVLGKILTTALVVSWNFLLYRFVVYR